MKNTNTLHCNFTGGAIISSNRAALQSKRCGMALDYGSQARNVGLKFSECAAHVDAQKSHVSGILAFQR